MTLKQSWILMKKTIAIDYIDYFDSSKFFVEKVDETFLFS